VTTPTTPPRAPRRSRIVTPPPLADLLASRLDADTLATLEALRARDDHRAALTAALAVADAHAVTVTHVIAPHTVSGNPRRAFVASAVHVLADGTTWTVVRCYTEHYRGVAPLADALREAWQQHRRPWLAWGEALHVTIATYKRLAREGDLLHAALERASAAERAAAAAVRVRP
jgi:hypothetical protein